MGQSSAAAKIAAAIAQQRLRWIRGRGQMLLVLDVLAWIAGFAATARVMRTLDGSQSSAFNVVSFTVVVLVAHLLVGNLTGIYRGKFRIGTHDEVVAITSTWLAAVVAISAIELMVGSGLWLPEVPVLFRSVIALSVMLFPRLAWRVAVDLSLRPRSSDVRRVVIFGAGEGGYLIVRSMLTDPRSTSIPVALLDDDPTKARRSFMGVAVAGTLDDLERVAERHQADLVVIAIPSASSSLMGRVVAAANQAAIEVRTLPSTSELVSAPLSVGDIRPITEQDLLGRAEVEVDVDLIADYVTGKRVMVTGAGGSIGSELCRQLSRFDPERLIMLDRDESGLHATQLAVEGHALLDDPSLVVADIRDRDRLFEVCHETKPHVVFHAAALKHLTLLELHPSEAVKTNVFGTQNVIDAAVASGADCIVNISTDKAADPTSVLGASKLLAEQIAAAAAERAACRVVSVRFGNVLGSRGSVIPTFTAQIRNGGPVTVTDPDVTRFFMTIPEAVTLVLGAGAIGRSGEILILDMGEPMKIVDLAERLIAFHRSPAEIVFTGLRPGEKLHEVLVSTCEKGQRREHPRIFHTSSRLPFDLELTLERLRATSSIETDELVALAVGDHRSSIDDQHSERVDLAS